MTPYSFALEKTPTILLRITDCVQPARFSERLSEDRFTLSEVIAHLADFEDIFMDRMRLAHEHPGAAVVAYDPDQRAAEKRYSTRDLHHELEVFTNRRRDTMDFLANLTAAELKQTYSHPELGEVAIEDQVHLLLGHDLYHIEQVASYLR